MRVLDNKQLAALRLGLEKQGFAVLDGLMSMDEAQSTRSEFRTLFSSLSFRTCIDSDTHRAGLRSDYIQSLDESEARVLGLPSIAAAISRLKAIGHAAARLCDGSSSMTIAPCAQIAVYPGKGTHYRRHGDNLFDPSSPLSAPSGFDNWRVWTVIMYVNRHWDHTAHGGCLRIFGRCAGAEAPLMDSTLLETAAFMDIEPLAGRVVVFNSLLHHEVQPVHDPALRCALTVWIWREDCNAEKYSRS
jgi:Rps23 Pro-64 3,4-dihydroxylase Tpa1-like proline 4-hydroxylase